MSKTVKALRNVLTVAALAVAFSFGASQLMAGSAAGTSCPYDPPNELGSCAGINCEWACSLYGDYQGFCPGGCCVCILS